MDPEDRRVELPDGKGWTLRAYNEYERGLLAQGKHESARVNWEKRHG